MTARKTPASATLNRPLHIPFGKGYDIPPLKAISAMKVNIMLSLFAGDVEASKDDIDDAMDKLRALGVENPEKLGDFEIGNELFSTELNVAMLNDGILKPEYDIACAAVIRWVTVIDGETAQDARKAAEELLANPTGRPRPQDHKAPAKKAPARKPAAKRTSSSR